MIRSSKIHVRLARPNALWRRRFMANREEISKLYDERFCRMWEFYLVGSELAFRRQGHIVWQLQMARRVDTVPLTRDYMVDRERARSESAAECAARLTHSIASSQRLSPCASMALGREFRSPRREADNWPHPCRRSLGQASWGAHTDQLPDPSDRKRMGGGRCLSRWHIGELAVRRSEFTSILSRSGPERLHWLRWAPCRCGRLPCRSSAIEETL